VTKYSIAKLVLNVRTAGRSSVGNVFKQDQQPIKPTIQYKLYQ